MVINDKEVTQKEFAFDGCHKFYLLKTYGEKVEAEQYGYKIYPIKELPRMFWNSCPLRFISTWDLTEKIVPQGFNAVTFEGVENNGKVVMDFYNDEYEEVQ